MNGFQRSSLRIETDDVLDPAEPFSQLFAGHKPSGQLARHGWRAGWMVSGSTAPPRSGVADPGMCR
jgi:hypothetical protein